MRLSVTRMRDRNYSWIMLLITEVTKHLSTGWFRETETSSASGQGETSPCDRSFSCLIQVACHHRTDAAQWPRLVICPIPVHTSVPPVWGSDRLLMPFICLCSLPPAVNIHIFHLQPVFSPSFSSGGNRTYFNFRRCIFFHLLSQFNILKCLGMI